MNNIISPELNMAINTSEKIREQSLDLNVGYMEDNDRWELIVRYTGNLETIRQELSVTVEELLGGFAIIKIPQNQIEALSQYSQILYIEKPKNLILSAMEGISASCVNRLRLPDYNLTGKNVLVACIDSGVDYFHRDFQNPDGTTRILSIWDQTIPGNPPAGYETGSEYNEEMINRAILAGRINGRELVPSYDSSGHGTAVLGIMASNGNASDKNIVGMAPSSGILVVKLGNPNNQGFPRTTQLMLGIDYVVRQAMKLNMPIAINISFGNNYGDHNGESILERYIDSISNLYRLNIVGGSGNEGLSAKHAEGILVMTPYKYEEEIEFVVENYMLNFNLQMWKAFEDDMDIYLKLPSGKRIGPFSTYSQIQNYEIDGNRISIIYAEPTPYNKRQEVYFSFTSTDTYISAGLWKIILVPGKIVNGRYNMWLPVEGSTTADVYFVRPSLSNTMVIPATARGVITVAAYDSERDTYAAFSGRGMENYMVMEKPDLSAPGVNINTCSVGGTYQSVTGTSFAAPFVTGACALLMEYGIVNGNAPYLYGEKMRASLIKGAVPFPYQEVVPDNMLGYGRLCVANSVRES